MDKLESVLRRFPQYVYDVSESSILYRLIESIIYEFNVMMDNIDRVDRMIGIDTTVPDDLYNRFGSLLNIEKKSIETDEQYRHRLKTSVTALAGGTTEAIRYAIACSLGINNDSSAMERIQVYDAWKYNGDPGEIDIRTDYGYIVCEIDLDQGIYSPNMENDVIIATNNVKSAGVIIQFVYHNYRIVYYSELENVTYATLSKITYDKVGE